MKMLRAGSTAKVTSWVRSVAAVLPPLHSALPPYTLGEAVAELGAYAQSVDAVRWSSRSSRNNRQSLRDEINAQTVTLGERLHELVAPLLDALHDGTGQEAVIAASANFHEEWHSAGAITEAFRDLCRAAQVPETTSRVQRALSAIIASQIGPAAHGASSLLSQAAEVLIATEEDLDRWREEPVPKPLTDALRLEMAKDILINAPAGCVTVWLAYYRAVASEMRTVTGPMTFLRPDWALPNAFDRGPHEFPEGAELREIRGDVPWIDELHSRALDEDNQFVLVRVDLGKRQLAGAEDDARGRVNAVLSVAVAAGGVSWQSVDAVAVLLNGIVRASSLGLGLQSSPGPMESYGMVATGEMLSKVAEQLGQALTRGPMPEHLVMALTALREARMTDHYEVLFHGAQRVTPRVSTALEDHALELIVSFLGVHPITLGDALQRRQTLNHVGRQIASQLMAPFNDAWMRGPHEGLRELEQRICSFSQDRRLVSPAKAIAHQAEIRALPMSDLQRADFENALSICGDPARERQLLEEIWRETTVLRARHRRVRNAINHGLPLNLTTLTSIRHYAEATSNIALDIALSRFKTGRPSATSTYSDERAWTERMDRIDHGISWAAEDSRTANDV
jgi:hypothetical protein